MFVEEFFIISWFFLFNINDFIEYLLLRYFQLFVKFNNFICNIQSFSNGFIIYFQRYGMRFLKTKYMLYV